MNSTNSTEFRQCRITVVSLCAISLALNFFVYEAKAGVSQLDKKLVRHVRASLQLSLCAVVFEEEHEDYAKAARYQAASSNIQRHIDQQAWSSSDHETVYEKVTTEDFSFTLDPEESWHSYRRKYFDEEHCEGMYKSIYHLESQ